MKAVRFVLLVVLTFFAIPAAIHAQGGCVDSPEPPPAVLMLIGAIGIICGSPVAMKILRKNKKR